MRENQKWVWMNEDHQERENTGEGERKEQREVCLGIREMWRA